VPRRSPREAVHDRKTGHVDEPGENTDDRGERLNHGKLLVRASGALVR
jgi:hypothetical protein